MDSGIIGILKKIKDERGEKIFEDKRLLRALFDDYAKGQYKGEMHLMRIAFHAALYGDLKAHPEKNENIRREYRIRMENE